jgi:hypothetical protein
MLKHLGTRELVTKMRSYINRRQLLLKVGVGALGSAAAIATLPAAACAQGGDESIEGSWYITVNLKVPSPTTFDALYGFAEGGVFTRLDGRNNAPALGTWKQSEEGGIIFSAILFNFTAGVLPSPTSRNGAILGKFAARVVNGTLTGTFTAEGILGLTDFYRSGTFTGTRIQAERP